jgi:transposase-like protein
VDEIWGFINKKERHVSACDCGMGDVWTFIALDSDSKLIPSYLVGKRDGYHADTFIADLAGRLKKRIQLSSDGLSAYEDAVERGFGSEVDYGQIVKTYSVSHLTVIRLKHVE